MNVVALRTSRQVMKESGSINLTLKKEGLSGDPGLKITEEPVQLAQCPSTGMTTRREHPTNGASGASWVISKAR